MKTLIEKIKSLNSGTIIRTTLLIISYINQVIAIAGIDSFANLFWYQAVSAAFTIIISAICAWKNNDFTHIAQLAGEVLKALKDKKIDEQEVKDLLETANANLEENIKIK